MSEKSTIIKMLEEEYQTWVNLLDSLNEEQANSIQFEEMSAKDKVSHLWAWQLRTNARLEAAFDRHDPVLNDWFSELDEETEEVIDRINEMMFQDLRHKSWTSVYADWKATFQRVIEMANKIPESDLVEVGKYPWMNSSALVDVLYGTHEHHVEHFEEIQKFANSR